MSSGERPIGTAKGKQPNTEALCQTPPKPPPEIYRWKNLVGPFLVHEYLPPPPPPLKRRPVGTSPPSKMEGEVSPSRILQTSCILTC